MTKTTIHLVASIQDCTLVVFYTDAHCWQFWVISHGGTVFGERKIYYTAEAAEKAGRKWIDKGSWGGQMSQNLVSSNFSVTSSYEVVVIIRQATITNLYASPHPKWENCTRLAETKMGEYLQAIIYKCLDCC